MIFIHLCISNYTFVLLLYCGAFYSTTHFVPLVSYTRKTTYSAAKLQLLYFITYNNNLYYTFDEYILNNIVLILNVIQINRVVIITIEYYGYNLCV